MSIIFGHRTDIITIKTYQNSLIERSEYKVMHVSPLILNIVWAKLDQPE